MPESLKVDQSMLSGCGVLPALEPEPLRRPPSIPLSRKRRKPSERFRILNAFVDYHIKHLSRKEIAVWMVLYRDCRDGTACTSQGKIAFCGGMCPRSVRNAISALTKRGLLEIVYQGGLNRGPSIYRPVAPAVNAGEFNTIPRDTYERAH